MKRMYASSTSLCSFSLKGYIKKVIDYVSGLIIQRLHKFGGQFKSLITSFDMKDEIQRYFIQGIYLEREYFLLICQYMKQIYLHDNSGGYFSNFIG